MTLNYTDVEILDFLIENAKIAPIRREPRESILLKFRRQFGLKHPLLDLCLRIHNSILPFLQKTPLLEMETKINTLFVYNFPIDTEFLERLKEEAEVLEVNEKRVILRYQNGDFKLEIDKTSHSPNDFENMKKVRKYGINFEDLEFLKFLAKKTELTSSPITKKALFDEYKATSRSKVHIHTISQRFRYFMVPFLQNSDCFDFETIIRIFYMCKCSLDKEFIIKMAKRSFTLVLRENVIVKFKCGSFEVGDPLIPDEVKNVTNMNDFRVLKQLEQRATGFLLTATPPIDAQRLSTYLGARIHNDTRFSMESRLRMLYYLHFPADSEFLEDVSKSAEVLEVDRHRIIMRYEKGDVKLRRFNWHNSNFLNDDDVANIDRFSVEYRKSIGNFRDHMDYYDENYENRLVFEREMIEDYVNGIVKKEVVEDSDSGAGEDVKKEMDEFQCKIEDSDDF